MRMVSVVGWTVGGIALCCAVACGSSAPAEPPPEETTTSGEEQPPAPPPPPPPALVHVVHASPDPGLSTFTIRLDDGPAVVTDLAAGSASGALEVTPGSHALHLLGVASVETGEAPEVLATSIEVDSGAHPMVIVFGEPSAEPPLTVRVLDEDTSESATRVRLLHGLVGVGTLDVCVGGTPLAAGLAPGTMAPIASLAEGSVALVVHAASPNACHGRAVGTAHATLAAGTAYIATITGHSGRRGRVTGALVVCSEGADTACASATLGAR